MKKTAYLFILCLLLTVLATPVFAADTDDTHITRGEFASLINKAYNFHTQADLGTTPDAYKAIFDTAKSL